MSSYGGKGRTLNAVLWTETAIGALFVLMRIYTRKFILRSAGWDDAFLFITLLLLVAYASVITAATLYGLGQYRADIPPEDYIQAMKYEVIAQGVCIFNIVTTKAAVAILLLRVVERTWHKVFIWFLLISNSIMATWCTIAIFIQCVPVEKVWNFMAEGSCWLDFAKVGITTSAYAVCIDFLIATIPCFIVWELNMKTKDKIITIIGLSLGVFAGLCGILRTTALTSLRSSEEYIHDTSDMLIYAGTENVVSVICASIPVIRPLWNRVVHGNDSSARGDHSQNKQNSYQLSNRAGSQGPERALGGHHGAHNAKVYSGASRHGVVLDRDNTSEETILRETKVERDFGDVVCQTEISIKYSGRNAGRNFV